MSGVSWTKEEVSKLKRVVRAISDDIEKQARWLQISEKLGSGKTKRECFDKYKVLKAERMRRKEEEKEQENDQAEVKPPGTVDVEVEPAPVAAAVAEAEVLAVAKKVEEVQVTEAKVEEVEVEEAKVEEVEVEEAKVEEVEVEEATLEEVKVEEEGGEVPTVAAADAPSEAPAEAPPFASSSAPPSAFQDGQLVEALYKGKKKWRSGKISKVRSNGKFDVTYDDDEEKEMHVLEENIRVPGEPEPSAPEAAPAPEPEAAPVPEPEAAPASEPTASVEDDVDDEFDDSYPPATEKITYEIAASLRQLIFGDPNVAFNKAWVHQGFFYTKEEDLTFGLIQTDGGPCGAVAAVQAYVLRDLLYGTASPPTSDAPESFKNPSKGDQKKAVCTALARIIWQCATSHDFNKQLPKRAALVVTALDTVQLKSSKAKGSEFKHDGATEFLQVTTCFNYDDVFATVQENMKAFMKKDGPGVVCMAYSCLLSRGIEQVAADMDSNFGMAPKMIGNHGYANQEFVNLFITGRATSNLFDGQKKFADDTGASEDEIIMGGIGERGDVGFLTLFEAFKSLEVGVHLKVPVCPIWVVCSESHYSTLFSVRAKDVNVDEAEQTLDIYYYDPLGEQDEEIKLTLDREKGKDIDMDGGDETDLTPPVDKVVRTKWAAVAVDWNGAEPIL